MPQRNHAQLTAHCDLLEPGHTLPPFRSRLPREFRLLTDAPIAYRVNVCVRSSKDERPGRYVLDEGVPSLDARRELELAFPFSHPLKDLAVAFEVGGAGAPVLLRERALCWVPRLGQGPRGGFERDVRRTFFGGGIGDCRFAKRRKPRSRSSKGAVALGAALALIVHLPRRVFGSGKTGNV